MSSTDDIAPRFESLLARIGSGLVGLWDVYLIESIGSLVHDPIASLPLERLILRRGELAAVPGFRFVGTAALRSELLDHNPRRPKTRGSYRETEWYDDRFERIAEPRDIAEVEMRLEADSSWLRGGPRYANDSG